MALNPFQSWGFDEHLLRRPPIYLQLRINIIMKTIFLDPKIIAFRGLDGPGSPTNLSKGRGALRLAFWNGFWGLRGRPDLENP